MIIYKENIFCFKPKDDAVFETQKAVARLIAFCRTIPPHRISMIRHVELNVEFDWVQNRLMDNYVLRTTQERNWRTATNLLKEMSSLTTLRIKIGRGRYISGSMSASSRLPVSGETPENRILTALIGIHASQSFVVEMAWSAAIRGELTGLAFNFVLVDPYPERPIINT